MAKDAAGMKGIRSRNVNGELRRKRTDTHISTIESKYNINLGVRSDMHLGTLLDRKKASSLSNLLNSKGR